MMLQEFITWDTYVRVPTIGRRWARAIRYDPAPGGMGGVQPGLRHPAARAARHERGAVAQVQRGPRLRHERARVRGEGREVYGIDLTNYTPDLDYRSLKDAHFPWAVEKMAEFAIEKRSPTSGRPSRRSGNHSSCGSRPVAEMPGARTTEPAEDARGDFGFGSRVAQQSEPAAAEPGRQLQRGPGGAAVLALALRLPRAPDHVVAALLPAVALGYYAANLFFAALYFACGGGALDGWHTGDEFRSLRGRVLLQRADAGHHRLRADDPNGVLVNLIVTVEALVGLMGFAVATGLLFARVSRPAAHPRLQPHAVVGRRSGAARPSCSASPTSGQPADRGRRGDGQPQPPRGHARRNPCAASASCASTGLGSSSCPSTGWSCTRSTSTARSTASTRRPSVPRRPRS